MKCLYLIVQNSVGGELPLEIFGQIPANATEMPRNHRNKCSDKQSMITKSKHKTWEEQHKIKHYFTCSSIKLGNNRIFCSCVFLHFCLIILISLSFLSLRMFCGSNFSSYFLVVLVGLFLIYSKKEKTILCESNKFRN